MLNITTNQACDKINATEVEAICNQTLWLGELVGGQLELALNALTTGGFKAAKRSINLTEQIVAHKEALEKECYQALALNKFTAFDLRFLITVIKIIHELKVIGELAETIAKMSIHFSNEDDIPLVYHEVEKLFNAVKHRLHLTLDVFSKINTDDTAVTNLYKKFDCEHTVIFLQLTTQIMKNSKHIKHNLRVLCLAKALERIGDHAFHIYKELDYLTRGLNKVGQKNLSSAL